MSRSSNDANSNTSNRTQNDTSNRTQNDTSNKKSYNMEVGSDLTSRNNNNRNSSDECR